MVRPSGTRGTGSTRGGQADPYDELRTRVSSWPPLRPARLRCERGSVGVVTPTAPAIREREGRSTDATGASDRHGHPPHVRGSGVLGRRQATAGRPGRYDTIRSGGIWPHALEG